MATSLFCAVITVSSVGSFALGCLSVRLYAKKGWRKGKRNRKRRPIVKGSHYVAAIYEKLVKYFEEKKPYLNSSLTIGDVANDIYTNKGYVSKAIKMAGKKNFNYLLNEYRIKYALELFRKDPGLRVNELAYKSGFNSPTSFTMAFKMIVNMPPGEWCRRYKMDSTITVSGKNQSGGT